MRFIHQADVQVRLPSDWDAQVTAATSAVVRSVLKAARAARCEGCTGAALRKKVGKAAQDAIRKSGVWRNAKDALACVSFDKCWYCECKQVRSDLHVDHFRPKGRVAGEVDHDGYWWLAFDWRNFRLACTYCNCVRQDTEQVELGGKGSRFPVFTPPPRMRRRGDVCDRPKLLDPMTRADVEKLTFTLNGLPRSVTSDEACDNWMQVQETVDVFHLRETRLKRARERLAVEIEEDFTVADRCYSGGDLKSFETLADRLVARIRQDAEYATFARLVLGSHRDVQWVESLWEHL